MAAWVPPFEMAAAEMRRIGIKLTRLPGEYRVNYSDRGDATPQMADDLKEAVEIGRDMADAAPPAAETAAAAPAAPLRPTNHPPVSAAQTPAPLR